MSGMLCVILGRLFTSGTSLCALAGGLVGLVNTCLSPQMMELGLEAVGEQLQGDGLRPLTADELSGLVR